MASLFSPGVEWKCRGDSLSLVMKEQLVGISVNPDNMSGVWVKPIVCVRCTSL